MKKILLLTISLVSTLFFTVSASALNIENSDIETFFNDNMDEMTSAYEAETKIQWNASKVEDIVDVYDTYYEQIGYLVIFDCGYLAFHNNLSVLDVATTGYPTYYKSTFSFNKPKIIYKSGLFYTDNEVNPGYDDAATLDSNATNIYYPLDDYYLKSGFQINSSMVQIPYFKDAYDSSSWGDYMGISFSYIGENSGAVLATMGLMYTLKVNGGADLTPYQTSYKDLRDSLYVYTGFDYDREPIMNQQVLSWGINDYLEHNYGDRYSFALVGMVNSNVPAVTLYYNSNPLATDYCLRVGHAQEPSWWIFNTYYDIVMANENNFFYDEFGAPRIWDDFDSRPFYVVNQNYRNEMFQFFEGDTLLT